MRLPLPKPGPQTECLVKYYRHPQNVSMNLGQNPSKHELGDEPPAVSGSYPIDEMLQIQN